MSAPGQELPPDRRASQGPDDPNAGNEESVGQYMEFDPGEDGYTFANDDDGNMIVTIGEAYERPREDGGFFDNLAEIIPDDILSKIASDMLRRVEQDKEAREGREKQYEEGLRRTGLGKDAPGGAEFEGASRVVHPMLTEACIDYESRIMKELWPVAGPCRERIVGSPTAEKAERAKRKTEFMNFQLTTQIKEARAVCEAMLTQVPLGGAQYIKQWWDHRLRRPRWQFVPIDDIYLPANASGWYAAHRRTLRDTVSSITLQERINSGMYKRVALSATSQPPDPSKAESANRKIEGLESPAMNTDGDREIYEVMTYLEVSEEMAGILQHEEAGDLYPYLLTIDVQSKAVLSFYRDWEPDDETYEPIDHIFEFPFIPWRGAYAIGLPQIIGGLSGAATGSLRALLDSAHIANTQGGLILKGSSVGSQTKRAQPGDFVEVEGGGLETPDIRSKVMMFNTKEPSGTLFQLLGFLVEASKGTVRTSLDETAIDMNTNVPVGTQLSRVEEGLVVFSSIHGRIHEAFNRLLAGLHRLNRLYLPDDLRVDAAGTEIMVRRKDFEGPPDVQAVSDPTIYSDQQRMAQIQAIQQREMVVPQLYDARKVEERFLKLLKVPDADDLLIPQPEPHELNAVNENVSMSMGKPVVAFPEQDHMAHLQTHVEFMAHPMFGSNPLIAPKFLPSCLDHLTQHIVFQYAKMTNDLVSGAANRQAVDLMSSDPMVKAAFDKLLAVASSRVIPQAAQMEQALMGPVQQAIQMLKAMQPPQPVDPGQAALQAAAAETARRGQSDQINAQLKAKEIETDAANNQERNAINAQRNQITLENASTAAQTRLTQAALDGANAREIAAMKIESGGRTNFSDGSSLGA